MIGVGVCTCTLPLESSGLGAARTGDFGSLLTAAAGAGRADDDVTPTRVAATPTRDDVAPDVTPTRDDVAGATAARAFGAVAVSFDLTAAGARGAAFTRGARGALAGGAFAVGTRKKQK